jgi:hypothetical protein
MLFKHIMTKVQEAKREIAKLQTSVTRLEAACGAGSIPEPATGDQAFSTSANRLSDEMRAFDGWTISLLESDISLVATADNPMTAGNRVRGLQASFALELAEVGLQAVRKPLGGLRHDIRCAVEI